MSPAELENCKVLRYRTVLFCAKAVIRGGNRRKDRDATIEHHKEEFKASRTLRGKFKISRCDRMRRGGSGYNDFKNMFCVNTRMGKSAL